MTHPVSFFSFFFLFYYVRNDYAIRNRGWEVSVSPGFCQRVPICCKQNVVQKCLCLNELPMKHRAGFHHKPAWLPASLPGSSPGSMAPGWLWTEPGILPDFFYFFFDFFFFFLEGKGLDRNTHWLCLAFSDCPELDILIVKTLHSPVPCFVMWESQGSFPPFLRSCSS